MRVAPVPGWRISVADLGLPSGEGRHRTRLARSDDPQSADPFIGNVDDNAFFLATSPTTVDTNWWLVGVNVASGQRLFPAVQLSTGLRAPKCVLNGPAAVLCVDDAADHATAWVIDVPAGHVSYSGPTDLRSTPGQLGVEQVGLYAVAQTSDEGVYGVGPKAETTWFVPGDGRIVSRHVRRDFAAASLATQTASSRGLTRMTVFRVSDGHTFTPGLPDRFSPGQAAVYPGGFAIEVREDGRGSSARGVNFYDVDGKQLGRADFDEGAHSLIPGAVDVPIVKSELESQVFGSDGADLARIPRSSDQLLIGSRLFFEGPENVEQYDLRTGRKVEGCRFGYRQSAYIATDGTVGLFDKGTQAVGMEIYAIELDTCSTVWTMATPPGAFNQVWRMNTTLVQLSSDATELMSLVAPAS